MNTLEDATSPYLLQHKNNPVHWREWSKDVLGEAQRLDRPILLSVGYAACHWCHVMAHESFENAEIAEQMNRDFLCVKVDREERPDIDAIYQHALAMLGQQGGWPLTMFLAPDGAPLLGWHLFSARAALWPPGPAASPEHIAELWRTDRNTALSNCQALTDSLEQLGRAYPAKCPRMSDLRQAAVTTGQEFDTIHGGLGGAPKFPQAPILRFSGRRPAPSPTRPSSNASSIPCGGSVRGASMTILGAVSPAIRSTPSGWCRISKRCSTTMPN